MTDTKNRQRSKYRTTNWKAYSAALKARGSLTMWLDPGMRWLGTPTGKRGRSPTFSDAAIQFCLSIKYLFGQPLRQALGMVQGPSGHRRADAGNTRHRGDHQRHRRCADAARAADPNPARRAHRKRLR